MKVMVKWVFIVSMLNLLDKAQQVRLWMHDHFFRATSAEGSAKELLETMEIADTKSAEAAKEAKYAAGARWTAL